MPEDTHGPPDEPLPELLQRWQMADELFDVAHKLVMADTAKGNELIALELVMDLQTKAADYEARLRRELAFGSGNGP